MPSSQQLLPLPLLLLLPPPRLSKPPPNKYRASGHREISDLNSQVTARQGHLVARHQLMPVPHQFHQAASVTRGRLFFCHEAVFSVTDRRPVPVDPINPLLQSDACRFIPEWTPRHPAS